MWVLYLCVRVNACLCLCVCVCVCVVEDRWCVAQDTVEVGSVRDHYSTELSPLSLSPVMVGSPGEAEQQQQEN